MRTHTARIARCSVTMAMAMAMAMAIHTLESIMRVDWIIRGIEGEFYPCKPDVFAAIYAAVSD